MILFFPNYNRFKYHDSSKRFYNLKILNFKFNLLGQCTNLFGYYRINVIRRLLISSGPLSVIKSKNGIPKNAAKLKKYIDFFGKPPCMYGPVQIFRLLLYKKDDAPNSPSRIISYPEIEEKYATAARSCERMEIWTSWIQFIFSLMSKYIQSKDISNQSIYQNH